MRHTLLAAALLLHCPGAWSQGHDLRVRLGGGGTVVIPGDEIRRIEFADLSGVTDPGAPAAARGFQLLQNHPNPANPATTIEVQLPDAAAVTLRVHDLQGAQVKTLLQGTQVAGLHRVTWDGTDARGLPVASGVYFSTVVCGGQALSRKLVLVK